MKPTSKTDWATRPEARLREPLGSQRELGWTTKDAPAASIVNYWMHAVHQKLAYGEACIDALQENSVQHGTELSNHQTRIESLEKRLTELEHLVLSLIKPVPVERENPPKIDTGGRPLPPIREPPFPEPRPPIRERGLSSVETKTTEDNNHGNDNH